jgi:hypothetical protein
MRCAGSAHAQGQRKQIRLNNPILSAALAPVAAASTIRNNRGDARASLQSVLWCSNRSRNPQALERQTLNDISPETSPFDFWKPGSRKSSAIASTYLVRSEVSSSEPSSEPQIELSKSINSVAPAKSIFGSRDESS